MPDIKYEIINPSDKCFITAPTLKMAAVAVCIIGEGRYSLKVAETGDTAVPMFLQIGHDEWFLNQFGMDFKSALIEATTDPEALIAVLKSFEYEGKPGSINNIGDQVKELIWAIGVSNENAFNG